MHSGQQPAVHLCDSHVVLLDGDRREDSFENDRAGHTSTGAGQLDPSAQLSNAHSGKRHIVVSFQGLGPRRPGPLEGDQDTGVQDQSAGHAGSCDVTASLAAATSAAKSSSTP